MPKVLFRFENGNTLEGFAREEETVLAVAKKYNVAIDAPCNGNASCGKCRVKLLNGSLDSPRTRHISEEEYASGWRLACVSKVSTDVEILVPDIASAYQSRMKTADLNSSEEIRIFDHTREAIAAAGIGMGNDLCLVSLTMDAPTMDDTAPDNERLATAAAAALQVEQVKVSFPALEKLSQLLRSSSFALNAVISKKDGSAEVLDVFPLSEKPKVCGLAVDIGTTTVAALLIDMLSGEILSQASAGNAQIRYGADVINRIVEQQKENGRRELQDAIVKETLNPIIQLLCDAAHVSPEQIYRVSIAGNTTMNHLLLGVDADPVRLEPFVPSFFETDAVTAADLGLALYPHAELLIAPNIGSYVGGDITAGTFSSMIWDRDELSLFIDLGTNGELVIGNRDFLVSCACSAGPAFEGGDISCGMRATDGAIEACRIDPDTMEPSFRVIGEKGQKPVGLCGSGIIDVISELFRAGIISPKGKFIREGERVRYDSYGMGSFLLVSREDAASVKDIEITEVDIDNFIRAKGSIFSAIRVMLSSLGLDVSAIDHVYVAGGIGSGINMQSAISIGMFPDIGLEKFSYIGNSSLAGAYAMLLSDEARQKLGDVAHNMTYLELSNDPSYMGEFVASCFLPHTDASLFPSVSRQHTASREKT